MEENLGSPLVSVCMPAYNAEKYLNEAVNSILQQSYTNIELIVVNDGSTDSTGKLLDAITHPNVKAFHTVNKGQCAAANFAYEKSTGDLIKFMDADDIISTSFIENQVVELKNSANSIAFASWGRFYNDDLGTFRPDTGFITSNMKPVEWLIGSMTGRQLMLQCALWLIPRSILKRSGLWNEQLSLINDFEFFIRVLLNADELKYTENAILYYRSGLQHSLSGTRSVSGAESAFNSIDLGTQHLLDFEYSSRTRKVAADVLQQFVYTFYPLHKNLIYKAEKKIHDLGGSDYRFPAGGYTKFLARLLGWKAAKQLKACFKQS